MTALDTLQRMQEWVRTVQTPERFWHAFALKGRETPNLRIWSARVGAGRSEGFMAEKLGICLADYRLLEKNGESVPLSTLRQISGLLSISESWLACAPEGAEQADLFGRPKHAPGSVAS